MPETASLGVNYGLIRDQSQFYVVEEQGLTLNGKQLELNEKAMKCPIDLEAKLLNKRKFLFIRQERKNPLVIEFRSTTGVHLKTVTQPASEKYVLAKAKV